MTTSTVDEYGRTPDYRRPYLGLVGVMDRLLHGAKQIDTIVPEPIAEGTSQ